MVHFPQGDDMTEKATPTGEAAQPASPTDLPDRIIAAAIALAVHRGLIPEPERRHLPINGYCR